jgi:hypothetical protein
MWLLACANIRLEAADKEPPFQAGPASSYELKQALDGVTIAVKAYDTPELAREAFGKFNPNAYEVLPVLVVIENKRKQAVRVDRVQVEYIIPGVGKLGNSSVEELLGVVSPTKPNMNPSPLPIPRRKVKNNPFNRPEIEQRAWAAKVIAPGEQASGFFYFQTKHRTSAKFYLTGLFEPATGTELFYFEIPFGQ